MKKIHALLFALLPITALPLQPAHANLQCDNGFCVQTFSYTGTTQTFEVPEGIGVIRYEIYGASGARGGAGALAQGYLRNLPDQLIIEVGGAGPLGANRAGGYNGGGSSGGARGNEGAGGGASDIRLNTSLESRIVVAGGGGGGGGYSGGAGGAAGLVGLNGVSGQGTAGEGGQANSGGLAGTNNSTGVSPTAGAFGVGGSGGSGLRAGGGGGGGGWYGGGGGGGDDDTSGLDGGGGGGGSSYAQPDYTSNATFETGLNWGHGRVMLYYQFSPAVTEFTGTQLNQNEISFNLVMNQYIQDLSAEDFLVLPTSCTIAWVSIDLNTAAVRVRNCPGGEVSLTLNPNSVGEWERGPLVAQTATAFFDKVGPRLSMELDTPRHSASDVVIPLSYSELVPLTTSFVLPNCTASISSSELVLSQCPEGRHQVQVRSNYIDDSWGNPGPLGQTFEFEVDRTAPSMSLSASVSGATTFSYGLLLHFTETVVIDPSAISFSSSMSCSHVVNLQTLECGYGELTWTINQASISDLVGYPVGTDLVTISLNNPAPVAITPATLSESISVSVPVSAPESVSAPAPIQVAAPDPEPTPQPEPGPAIVIEPLPAIADPTQSEEVSVSSTSSVSEPVSESEVVQDEIEIEPVFETPRLEPVSIPAVEQTAIQPRQDVGTESPAPVAFEPVASPTSVAPESEATPARADIQLVAGPEIELPQREIPWIEIGVVAFLFVLIGLGVYRTIGR